MEEFERSAVNFIHSARLSGNARTKIKKEMFTIIDKYSLRMNPIKVNGGYSKNKNNCI